MNLDKNIKIVKSKAKLLKIVEDLNNSKGISKPLLIWFKSNTHLDVLKKLICKKHKLTSYSPSSLTWLPEKDLNYTSTTIFHDYLNQMNEDSLRRSASLSSEKNIKVIYLANMYEYKNRPDFTSDLFDEVLYDIKSVIILNHMFTGNYLEDNIGHEIINLFRADNDKHYIYLCRDGIFNRDDVQVEHVVQVCRPAKTTKTLKILNVANEVTTHIKKDDKSPKYGGVSIYDIFKNNIKQQDVCVTFDARFMSTPEKDLYIWAEGVPGYVDNGVVLKKLNPSQQLREYIYEEYDESWKTKTDSDYFRLKNLIVGVETMKIGEQLPKVDPSCVVSVTATDIYGIQGRELSYSNAFKYFIDEYPELLREFCRKRGCKSNLGGNITVYREWNNIDILIESEDCVIVVENKIFSGLNGVVGGKTQLDKYKKIIEEKEEFKNKKPIFIFLTPNHNKISVNKPWTTIEYSEIYDFLKSKIEVAPYKDDFHFVDFVKSLEDHSKSDYIRIVMEKKFVKAVKKTKQSQ